MKGLEPWQRLEVAFVNPAGRRTKWIGSLEYEETWSAETIFADEAGIARWTRYGGMDRAGKGWIEVGTDEEKRRIEYHVEELQLPDLEWLVFGARLELYRGPRANIYFADAVPAAYAADLEEHLALTASLLEERLGLSTEEKPNIFLLGNDLEFQQAYKSSGLRTSVWSGGFYAKGGIIPGIYMRAFNSRSRVRQTLAHESVHFVVAQISSSRRIPSWLNEGMAGYYEIEAGLPTERPEVALYWMHRSADRAREAALEERLLPLSELENRRRWNGRSDIEEVRLQYAQSHMVVRYLTETYGQQSPGDIATEISGGNEIKEAVESVTGVTYNQLEQDFIAWLKEWDSPERAEARPYLESMQALLNEIDAISGKRAEAIEDQAYWDTAIQTWTEFLAESERLLAEVRSAVPPQSYSALHHQATDFLEHFRDWTDRELKGYRTSGYFDWKPVNAMIPEVNAREVTLWRSLQEAQEVLNLTEPTGE